MNQVQTCALEAPGVKSLMKGAVAAEPDNPGVKAMDDEQPSEFAHKPSTPGNSPAGGPTVAEEAEEEEHKRGGKGAELREHNDCLQGMVLQDLYRGAAAVGLRCAGLVPNGT